MRTPTRSQALAHLFQSYSLLIAVSFGAAGVWMEPSKVSNLLYVASILCAGMRVLRFIVHLSPEHNYSDERIPADQEPTHVRSR